MENKKFVEHIEENKKQIEEVLEIDTLKDEIMTLKKEMEMLSMFKKFFQNNGNNDDATKLDELKSKNKQLKQEVENSRIMVLNLQQEQKQQLNENKKLDANIVTLKDKNLTLEKELIKIKNTPFDKLQTLYASLSSTTQSGLKNSLHSDNPLILFTSGILHIEPLWEYTKYLLVEEKMEDFATLREIFYILFEPYKNVEDLEYQKVSIGEEFDSHIHIRDAKSEPAGSIQAIQLKGFCTEDGEVVKKTIVRVL